MAVDTLPQIASEASAQEQLAISKINIKNLLSFGPAGIGLDNDGLELRALNILIGVNGSGKSNFLNVLGLLQAAARREQGRLAELIERSGGVGEWIWQRTAAGEAASIDALLPYPSYGDYILRYHLAFGLDRTLKGNGSRPDSLVILNESLDDADRSPANHYLQLTHNPDTHLNRLGLSVVAQTTAGRQERILSVSDSQNVSQTGLSQAWGGAPEAALVQRQFDAIRLYADWSFGRNSLARTPRPNSGDDTLSDDASNLVLALNRLLANPATKLRLITYLEEFYQRAKGLDVQFTGDEQLTISLLEGLDTIPLNRLSEGTLQWLALMVVLLDPAPAPLICLEEPEVNLHPDAIPLLAELLQEAARRTQLVVTTHSDFLVNEFTSMPQAVVVCDKINNATRMQRLDSKQLNGSLERYTLGQLWNRGFLGGRR